MGGRLSIDIAIWVDVLYSQLAQLVKFQKLLLVSELGNGSCLIFDKYGSFLCFAVLKSLYSKVFV